MTTRYEVNDALTALAQNAGVEVSDETLNETTHYVADAFGIEVSDPIAFDNKSKMIDPVIYEQIITDVLDTVAEMRSTGDYDENTLETLEWKLSPPKTEETK